MIHQYYLYIGMLSPHDRPHDNLTTPSRHVKNLTTQRWVCDVFREVFCPHMRDIKGQLAYIACMYRRTIRTSRPHDKNKRYVHDAKKIALNQGILAGQVPDESLK